ncbi:MAG: acyltransferase family protein [Phycisphaerales bacterium]|nr:MAG: acyltransferase family protein [Phycisphaerales bacterium]
MEKPRLLFIDNLRILLITLVAMVHLSISYGGVGSWYYKEGQSDTLTSVLLSWHNGTVQAFSMGLFFLIAGYFTPGSYDRKGPGQFLTDRLLRLGIPMLCFDIVIGPLMAYPLMRLGGWQAGGSYFDFLIRYYGTFHIGTGPLWFVEALLIFAIVYALWRAFVRKTAPVAQSNGRFPGSLAIAALAVALGTVSFIVRIWLPIGWAFEPLNLQFPFFPQYICLFIVGAVAYRQNWLLRIPNATGRFWLLVAVGFVVVLLPALFVAGGALSGDPTPFMGGLHWQCFAYALWEQVAGVAIIIALLVLFRKRLNHQGELARAASASAYTAYIIHGPIVILVALTIRNVALHPLLKFALAVLISVPLCFVLGNVVRKLPLAGRIL